MKKETIFIVGIALGTIFAFFAATAGWIDFSDIVRSWGWKDAGELVRFMMFAFLLVVVFGGIIALLGYISENSEEAIIRILKKFGWKGTSIFGAEFIIFVVVFLIGWILNRAFN